MSTKNTQLVDIMFPAVRRQEGPAKYDPAKQIDTRDGTIRNSIRKNYDRWLLKYPQALDGVGPDFVTFMGNEGGPVGKGWARPGVKNDPKGLNKNWIPGVKSIMRQMLGPDAAQWKRFNIIQNKPMDRFVEAV